MPCQCGTTANADAEPDQSGCGCATEPAVGCGCAGGVATPSDQESSLERVVMELDKRVRRLETSK